MPVDACLLYFSKKNEKHACVVIFWRKTSRDRHLPRQVIDPFCNVLSSSDLYQSLLLNPRRMFRRRYPLQSGWIYYYKQPEHNQRSWLTGEMKLRSARRRMYSFCHWLRNQKKDKHASNAKRDTIERESILLSSHTALAWAWLVTRVGKIIFFTTSLFRLFSLLNRLHSAKTVTSRPRISYRTHLKEISFFLSSRSWICVDNEDHF